MPRMPRKLGCSDICCITICLLCNATIVMRFYCTGKFAARFMDSVGSLGLYSMMPPFRGC